jgi:hypothetical protein
MTCLYRFWLFDHRHDLISSSSVYVRNAAVEDFLRHMQEGQVCRSFP